MALKQNIHDQNIYVCVHMKYSMVVYMRNGASNFRVMAENAMGVSEPSKSSEPACISKPATPDINPNNVRTDRRRPGWLIIKWDVSNRITAMCILLFFKQKFFS